VPQQYVAATANDVAATAQHDDAKHATATA